MHQWKSEWLCKYIFFGLTWWWLIARQEMGQGKKWPQMSSNTATKPFLQPTFLCWCNTQTCHAIKYHDMTATNFMILYHDIAKNHIILPSWGWDPLNSTNFFVQTFWKNPVCQGPRVRGDPFFRQILWLVFLKPSPTGRMNTPLALQYCLGAKDYHFGIISWPGSYQ